MIVKIVYIKPRHIDNFQEFCRHSGIEIHSNKNPNWITNPHHIVKISCAVEKYPQLDTLLKMIK